MFASMLTEKTHLKHQINLKRKIGLKD